MKIHPHREVIHEQLCVTLGQTRSCRDLWRQGRVVPHNKKKKKKRTKAAPQICASCVSVGRRTTSLNPMCHKKKTERVITEKKRCFRNKKKRYFSHEKCTFFCLHQVLDLFTLTAMLESGRVSSCIEKKKSHYSGRFHSLVASPLPARAACADQCEACCCSVWLEWKRPADTRASPAQGSGRALWAARDFIVLCF